VVVYKLKFPVEYDGEKVIEIEFARPKGKHIKKMGADTNLASLIGVACMVTKYTPRFFDELDSIDYVGVGEIIGGFLDDGQ